MGMFDTYAGVQLKVGPKGLKNYKIGHMVEDTEDGIYFGHEGVVVIVKAKLVAKFDFVSDKWGNKYAADTLFNIITGNPTFKLLFMEKYNETKRDD